MNMENQPLVTNELVEFWKENTSYSSKIQEITKHIRRIFRIYLKLIKKKWKVSTSVLMKFTGI